MFNTLTIDFQDLVAPKGAVLCVVKYTRYFTRKIVPRTSLATAAPLSSVSGQLAPWTISPRRLDPSLWTISPQSLDY